MRRTSKDIYFKKIRNLHKAMPLDEEARERFKKETGFTEYEDSLAIGRGLHQSENLHYTEKGYGYKKLVQMEREKSIIKSERKEDA
jgi:hypothetical protein